MKFIMIILVFCSVVASATETKLVKCAKGAGALHKEKDFKKLRALVLDHIKKAEKEALLSLASCDFMVGKPETDTGGFVNPKDVMSLVITILKNKSFKDKDENYDTQIHVGTSEVPSTYQLVFRKDALDVWFWAGFITYDEKLEAKLTKTAYSLKSEKPEDSEE